MYAKGMSMDINLAMTESRKFFSTSWYFESIYWAF